MNEQNEQKMSSATIALLSFIGGAVIGAVAVALTTPKTGRQVRRDLKALGLRAKDHMDEMSDQIGDVWTESRERTGQSVADLRRGAQEAAADIKRGLADASEDLKRGMREAAADLRAPSAPSAGVNGAKPI